MGFWALKFAGFITVSHEMAGFSVTLAAWRYARGANYRSTMPSRNANLVTYLMNFVLFVQVCGDEVLKSWACSL